MCEVIDSKKRRKVYFAEHANEQFGDLLAQADVTTASHVHTTWQFWCGLCDKTVELPASQVVNGKRTACVECSRARAAQASGATKVARRAEREQQKAAEKEAKRQRKAQAKLAPTTPTTEAASPEQTLPPGTIYFAVLRSANQFLDRCTVTEALSSTKDLVVWAQERRLKAEQDFPGERFTLVKLNHVKP